jgi:signal transduction histidine kinase
LSEHDDQSAAIERLERRVAREKAARLQAEAITERVTSDRWDVQQQLEHKLALRTAELDAARRTAAEAVNEKEHILSEMSHNLRTPLTALFFLAESLCEEEPPGAQRLEELSSLLSHMQAIMDSPASASATAGADSVPGKATATGSSFEMTLADIISAHEGGWHQVAARSGKLLMLDIGTRSGQSHVGTAEAVSQTVLNLIRDRLETSERVIELHLTVGPSGLEVR